VTRALLLLLLVACPRDERFVDRDGDGATADEDCNDDDPDIGPLAFEIPYDGIDNDCSSSTPDDDLDGDGLGPPADCDDNDPNVRPGILERPYDGIDQDCDESTLDDDLDQDGVNGADDCNDNAPGIYPGNVETYYDGIDNDCDPLTTPDDDQDRDGIPVDDDCDDQNGLVRAGLMYYLDCDADGFAESVDGAVQACDLPPTPAACGTPDGLWTIIEPVGPAFDPANTTVDCSDANPDAFPGQTARFENQTLDLPPDASFDYDCDGAEEPEYPDLYTCAVIPGSIPGTTICQSTTGFETPVGCGVVGLLQEGCVETSPTTCEPALETPTVSACH
jgi:hypothetical protein